MGSRLTALAAAAAATVLICGIAPANAQTSPYTIIGTETQSGGWTGDLFGGMFSNGPYSVASDGEANFDPFNYGHDTSDGLDFSAVGYDWFQATGGLWTPNGYNSWVLPADLSSIGCGTENETTCEPVGHFWSATPWVQAAIGTWVIADWPGDTDYVFRPGWSDVIITYNDANGANLLFYSDAIPEPSAWAMMLIGFAGLGFAGYRARKPTTALAV
jgi:hypothetical protein